ncbi:MAG: dipeptide ABC transporter ATP-binding protein [Cyanophyceae cyanobacterium]
MSMSPGLGFLDASPPPPLLMVDHLHIAFPTPAGSPTVVVEDLSFELSAGQTLGIVGESGSGKTLTARALMGLVPAQAQIQGKALLQIEQGSPLNLLGLSDQQMQQVRGRRLGMVFQEPASALTPVFTCGYQLRETLRATLSLSKAEIAARCRQLFEEVHLDPSLLDRYPHQLSGGQLQRVGIALAMAGDPQILIADEPTTALDVTIQAEILALLRQVQAQRQVALIFISHDLGVISTVADRVLVMYRGRVMESGPVAAMFQSPQSPYTQSLIACRPQLGRPLRHLPTTDDLMQVATQADGSWTVQAKAVGSLDQLLRVQAISPSEVKERQAQIQQRDPLLKVTQLKTYFPVRGGWGRPQGMVKAVDGVSFEIYPGETLGLVGESGCGKSTLGRTLLRLIPASGGQIIYDGDDLLALPTQRLRRLRRELQLVFQDPFGALDPRMSVGESVMEPMRLHQIGENRQERQQRVRELFLKVGLDPQSLDRQPHAFSGGQRQRICIARALASQPRLIVCDEAVSSLDVSVQAQVLNLLKQLQAELGLTYLFISHDLAVVQFMSDRIMVMNHGQVEEIGSPEQIYQHPQRDYTRRLIAAIPA